MIYEIWEKQQLHFNGMFCPEKDLMLDTLISANFEPFGSKLSSCYAELRNKLIIKIYSSKLCYTNLC